MSLTLHFHPLASYCHKVLIALYENDTPFTPNIVDLVVIGARETEIVSEGPFDGLAVVPQISSEQRADNLRFSLTGHLRILRHFAGS